ALISQLDISTSKAGRVQTGNLFTQSGLLHSCDLPTKSSPAPRPQTISVPLASNDTMRITRRPYAGNGSRNQTKNLSNTANPPKSTATKAMSPIRLLRKNGNAAV